MRQAIIYKIINDINSKIYVGQTYKTVQQRFERHCSESNWKNTKRMPIVLAIQKYGREHFSVHVLEILPVGLPQTEVDKKEVEWGLKLNTLSPHGYNLKLGSGPGTMSEETKIKISNSNKGKVRSPEAIERLRISHLGKKRSPESLAKASAKLKLIPNHINSRTASSLKCKKHYHLVSPCGKIVHIYGMSQFAKIMKLGSGKLSSLNTGRILSYKGWTMASAAQILSSSVISQDDFLQLIRHS